MKALYLDCFSGISGDMTVGALVDLGVKPSALEWELSKLEIGDFHMHFDREQRQKIEGVHFSIHEGATHTHDQDEEHDHEHEHDHDHGHDHEHDQGHDDEENEHVHSEASSAHPPQANDQDHGSEIRGAKARHQEEHVHSHKHSHEHKHHHEHAHGHGHAHDHDHGSECCGHHHHPEHEVHGRTHREIQELIEKSDLSAFVKQHALSIFQRIADAEGKIHGMPAEDVHFHEVGALDSIADVVCVCAGLEALGIEKVFVSAMHEGRGWIECAHGRFPLPAPATLEIFKGVGISLGETDETHELITPTGAAIVAEFAVSSGPMPRMKVEKVGYGVGSRDLASRPNVLRAVIGELE